MMKTILLTSLLLLASHCANAQSSTGDSAAIDYQQIFAKCLDGDVKTALTLLEFEENKNLSTKDLQVKAQFEERFKGAKDESDYLETRKSSITPLLTLYRDYWRASLLEHSNKYDSSFGKQVAAFLIEQNPAAHQSITNEDSIDVYLKKYIESFGLHTTGFGKTGQYIDLLVWKTQKDTTYSFTLNDELTSARVVFMDSFITLGWEEYATLGRAFPGGWTTLEALYCVKNAYNLSSEEFLVSYLAHESRHFADYKLFPKLQSADLEYRAKLTELSMAKETLFKTIESFIQNANYDSENGHSIAAFCVIRDLSKSLFQVDFEPDIAKWQALSINKINASASELLLANTNALRQQGSAVEYFIKKPAASTY
jgi:hypothetical protein